MMIIKIVVNYSTTQIYYKHKLTSGIRNWESSTTVQEWSESERRTGDSNKTKTRSVKIEEMCNEKWCVKCDIRSIPNGYVSLNKIQELKVQTKLYDSRC